MRTGPSARVSALSNVFLLRTVYHFLSIVQSTEITELIDCTPKLAQCFGGSVQGSLVCSREWLRVTISAVQIPEACDKKARDLAHSPAQKGAPRGASGRPLGKYQDNWCVLRNSSALSWIQRRARKTQDHAQTQGGDCALRSSRRPSTWRPSRTTTYRSLAQSGQLFGRNAWLREGRFSKGLASRRLRRRWFCSPQNVSQHSLLHSVFLSTFPPPPTGLPDPAPRRWTRAWTGSGTSVHR